MLIHLRILFIVLITCLISSCPADGEGQRASDQPNVAVSQQLAPSNGTAQHSDPSSAELDTAEGASPRANSLVPLGIPARVNQPVQVSYSLAEPSTGDAFIVLVPGAVTSALLKDNVKQAVDRVTLEPGGAGQVELIAHHPGNYAVRLFTAQTGEIMAVAEATVSFTDQPLEGELILTPPYVTITDRELPEVPEQVRNRPMIAYWELADAPGPDAWIGLVSVTCAAQDAASNLEAAVDVQYLDGKVKDRSVFILSEPGEFVFRVFASKDAPQMLCESQLFRVVEPPEPEAQGEQ